MKNGATELTSQLLSFARNSQIDEPISDALEAAPSFVPVGRSALEQVLAHRLRGICGDGYRGGDKANDSISSRDERHLTWLGHGGRIRPDGAAARLGLKRTTLHSKMRKLRIERPLVLSR